MWLTAIILGFAGSLHCIGMCSPLAMAATSIRGGAVVNKLIYNGGRILMYGFIGALIASFGMAASFTQFQFIFTLALGIVMVLMGVAGFSTVRIPVISSFLLRFNTFIKKTFGKFLQKRTRSSMLVTGMLNGLLPCGLTFFALTYCLTLAGPLDGFNFMILFGAGTLPAMLGLTSLFSYLIRKTNWNMAAFTRYSYIIIGAIVLARLIFAHQHAIRKATQQVIMLCQ